jgi:hypothetical protein
VRNFNRRLGCGLWVVWLLLALFAGEWLLLLLVIQAAPQDRLIPAVLTVVILTILAGWVAVYLRIQRRRR